MKIIFATNNQHKVDEIKSVLPNHIQIITLKEAGIDKDIPEPHDTIEANAIEKARVIHQLTNENCFSEDTGLEVFALSGEPGVKSARYAGDDKAPNANIKKLLTNLQSKSDRRARFKTVICMILNKQEYLFEGICTGRIIDELKGEKGFGYDPVFIPDGSEKTFAEMTMEEKNKFSHRRKATDELVSFLNKLQ